MIITLKGATFSNYLDLNSWMVISDLVGVRSSNTETKVTKGQAYTTTFTINEGYTLNASNVSVICNGATQTLTWSSMEAGGTATLNVTPTSTIYITIKATSTSGSGGGEPEPTSNYTFTINPDPTSATVTLSATGYSTVSGTGSRSITVADGTVVNWTVSASGYTTRTGNWTISGGNKTENIALTATSGGGSGDALDLSTLSLAHCSSSKIGTGNKENLAYDQSTHVLTVANTGWYKVSYFTTPIQIGTEIEFDAGYSSSMTGNFIGLYVQDDLEDGIAEAKSSFWPAPSVFGLYASGGTASSTTEPLYQWDTTDKTKVENSLASDCNGKNIKLKLTADGVKVFVDNVELVLPRVSSVSAGTNYYLGFHNSCSNKALPAQTMKYIGPIR